MFLRDLHRYVHNPLSQRSCAYIYVHVHTHVHTGVREIFAYKYFHVLYVCVKKFSDSTLLSKIFFIRILVLICLAGSRSLQGTSRFLLYSADRSWRSASTKDPALFEAITCIKKYGQQQLEKS